MQPFSTCAFPCHHALNLEPNQRWDTGAHQIKLSTSVNKVDCRMKFRPDAKWASSFVFRPQVYSNPVIGNARNLRLLPQKQATCKTWVCIECTVYVLRVNCSERAAEMCFSPPPTFSQHKVLSFPQRGMSCVGSGHQHSGFQGVCDPQ